MKRLVNILIVMMALLPLASCHDQPEWKNDPYGNFDALWTILDEHYCFFAYKNVDWQEVRQRYRAKIHGGISSRELFDLCSDMLKELQDGHTNLISTFDVSRYCCLRLLRRLRQRDRRRQPRCDTQRRRHQRRSGD